MRVADPVARLLTVAALALPGQALAQQDAPGDNASEAQTPPPKVTVVVAGDPDETVRQGARRVSDVVASSERMRGPTDPGLRGALRGEPAPKESDGLERARNARRRLGWGEKKDLPVLQSIGRMTGADLIAVVRHGPEQGAEVVAVDVTAGAFYEGSVAPSAGEDELEGFLASRAQAAAKREGPPGPSAGATPSGTRPAAGGGPPPSAGPAPAGGRGSAPQPSPEKQASEKKDGEDDGGVKAWLADNWPYLVGGALLAGTVTAFAVRQSNDGSSQPVLRFQPGGQE
jgi:hypothetical protein